MPGFDRTGPSGNGPMTGRRRGYCAGNNENKGFAAPPFAWGRGRGFQGYGFGRGRGFGRYTNWYGDEKSFLENEIRMLKDYLAELEKQLKDKDKGI
ncbi:MAG: DUF5320 domain-containing protein [Bacteroidetes bacterium]|nr:DUF5320 domain-containing protein [Bacteroidota bacterium]